MSEKEIELIMKIGRIQQIIDDLKQENKQLKKRIDETIEYTKNHTKEYVDTRFETHNVMVEVDEYFNPYYVIDKLKGDF